MKRKRSDEIEKLKILLPEGSEITPDDIQKNILIEFKQCYIFKVNSLRKHVNGL